MHDTSSKSSEAYEATTFTKLRNHLPVIKLQACINLRLERWEFRRRLIGWLEGTPIERLDLQSIEIDILEGPSLRLKCQSASLSIDPLKYGDYNPTFTARAWPSGAPLLRPIMDVPHVGQN